MFCPNCGTQSPDGLVFCPECGTSFSSGAFNDMAQPAQPMMPEAQPYYEQPMAQPYYEQPMAQPMYSPPPAQPMYEQPVAPPMYGAPVAPPSPYGQPMPQQPMPYGSMPGATPPPAKKKGKMIAILAGAAVVIIIVVVVIVLLMSGDPKDPNGPNTGGNITTTDNDIREIRAYLQTIGRNVDAIHVARVGERTSNVFFDWTVKSVTVENTLTNYNGVKETPFFGSGYRFVVVDTLVKNTFDKSIPVGYYDFFILYKENGKYVEDYAYEEFMPGMYPDDVTIATGQSVSGKVVLEAPINITSFYIVYYEIWGDNSYGDAYLVEVNLR